MEVKVTVRLQEARATQKHPDDRTTSQTEIQCEYLLLVQYLVVYVLNTGTLSFVKIQVLGTCTWYLYKYATW